jgi:hypothetical protein
MTNDRFAGQTGGAGSSYECRTVAKTFTYELNTDKPQEAVRAEVLTTLTSPLNTWGYRLTTQSDSAFTYERTYRPWYVWLIGVLLLPAFIGLLILIFWTSTETITLVLEAKQPGSRVLVQGQGPERVQQAFRGMQF